MANSGRRIPRRMLQRAIDAEPSIARRINRIFDDVDVVLTPGAVQPPPRIGEQDGHGASRTLMGSGKMIPHFAPWNVIGQPATSLPAGFTTAGLPLSVQFAGRPNDEATLLALCTQVEKTRPWAQHRPPTLS
ncbi:MAG: amidase family protein [Acidimicrobiales bacterium]